MRERMHVRICARARLFVCVRVGGNIIEKLWRGMKLFLNYLGGHGMF